MAQAKGCVPGAFRSHFQSDTGRRCQEKCLTAEFWEIPEWLDFPFLFLKQTTEPQAHLGDGYPACAGCVEQKRGKVSPEMSIKGEGHSQPPTFSSDSEDWGAGG